MTKLGMKLVVLTGRRPGEVRKAIRDDVDLEDGKWLNRNTKTGIDNLVHLSPLARNLFEQVMQAGRTRYVFPDKANPREPVNKHVWPSAQHHLIEKWIHNMDGATVHDLRRTCATGMGRLGVPQSIIDACQARVPQGVGATTYNLHHYEDQKADAWNGWAEHLFSL